MMIRPLLLLSIFYLLGSSILRFLLWWRFGLEAAVGAAELPSLVARGLVNDLVALGYLMLPFSIYLALIPRRWHQARWHRGLLVFGTFLFCFGLLYLNVVEYFFFDEFNARLNLVAVDYLIYPHEVLVNIRESYPVAEALIAIGLASLAVTLWLAPRMFGAAPTRLSRRRWVLAHSAAVALFGVGLSADTLAHLPNRVASEIAMNGIETFFQALHTNDLDYRANYRVDDGSRLLTRLRQELADDESRFVNAADGSLRRHHPGRTDGLGRVNVIVVVEESLGAEFVGALGDTRGLTPGFDALAAEGLLFTRAFATGTRTVRGLEAITTSMPPIPSESILKRPGYESVANWGDVMRAQGYHTSFLYGGYGYFDNMNAFYASNGFVVSDRTDIANPRFGNVWGVSDQDLFAHALDYFDVRHVEGRPFFSMIMTTSNHKPFTFPAGTPGVPQSGGGRKAGARYADFALSEFLNAARGHDWFDETLFVVVADHGPRVYGRAQIPLNNYRIPLLLWAPGLIASGRNDTATSQIDLAPTVLGLLGLEYEAPFFGSDVLRTADAGSRTLLFNHNHDIGLLRDDRLVVLGLQQRVDTYAVDAADLSLQPVSADPALTELATAYYQTAAMLFAEGRYR